MRKAKKSIFKSRMSKKLQVDIDEENNVELKFRKYKSKRMTRLLDNRKIRLFDD